MNRVRPKWRSKKAAASAIRSVCSKMSRDPPAMMRKLGRSGARVERFVRRPGPRITPAGPNRSEEFAQGEPRRPGLAAATIAQLEALPCPTVGAADEFLQREAD